MQLIPRTGLRPTSCNCFPSRSHTHDEIACLHAANLGIQLLPFNVSKVVFMSDLSFVSLSGTDDNEIEFHLWDICY